MIIENNANQLYKSLIREVWEYPNYQVAPRGMQIKELIGYQFRLTNPKDCLVTLKSRKLNYRFSIIEKFEYLYGIHSPERLIAYNKKLESWKGKYNYFDGNYAQRFNFWLRHCYELLIQDPDTRQAVISIYDPTARHQSSDIPCTLTLQFFLRGGRLHLMVNMRSNDLLWGTPYDINAFCFLQEVMASWLQVEMGEYIHTNGSTHIYLNEHTDQLLSCLNEVKTDEIINPRFDLSFEETQKYIPMFMAAEQSLREGFSYEWKNLYHELPRCLTEYFDIIATKWLKET